MRANRRDNLDFGKARVRCLIGWLKQVELVGVSKSPLDLPLTFSV